MRHRELSDLIYFMDVFGVERVVERATFICILVNSKSGYGPIGGVRWVTGSRSSHGRWRPSLWTWIKWMTQLYEWRGNECESEVRGALQHASPSRTCIRLRAAPHRVAPRRRRDARRKPHVLIPQQYCRNRKCSICQMIVSRYARLSVSLESILNVIYIESKYIWFDNRIYFCKDKHKCWILLL